MNLISAMFLCLCFFLSSLKKRGEFGFIPLFSACFFFYLPWKKGESVGSFHFLAGGFCRTFLHNVKKEHMV